MRLSKDNSELSEKAYIDLATGLPNKNKCEEILTVHRNISKPTACFMLDLNDLKKVNDTLGHEMGDIMILNFAKLLRKVVPLQYFVGRFGGDEFIVIAEGGVRKRRGRAAGTGNERHDPEIQWPAWRISDKLCLRLCIFPGLPGSLPAGSFK